MKKQSVANTKFVKKYNIELATNKLETKISN